MLKFLTVFTLLILLISSDVSASCMVKPSVEVAARESVLVFTGKVTKITPAQLASADHLLKGKKSTWEKHFYKTDIVSFDVTEIFKGTPGETIEIATSADGDAGYKFEGGTWLREGESYFVYANERRPAGTVDTDWTGYGKAVARELKKIQESFPKELAAEINDFNSKLTPYSADICGRTRTVNESKEDLDELHRIFPNTKRLRPSANDAQVFNLEMMILAIVQRILA
jgi:hypothetical protein